jgi:uncharacterized membrane protein YfcA
VHTGVEDPVHADEPVRVRAGPPADTRDKRIAPRQPPQLRPRLLGNLGQLRPRDDRRERAVDVEHDRGTRGIGSQSLERILHANQNTAVRLVVIGLLAGLFSALFGVGGGTVIVPLLMLVAAYALRPASATSLAAVALISVVGAITYAFHGELKPGAAALVGLPAVAGAVAGTALQQRLATRTLSIAFAVLLAAIGARLLV